MEKHDGNEARERERAKEKNQRGTRNRQATAAQCAMWPGRAVREMMKWNVDGYK